MTHHDRSSSSPISRALFEVVNYVADIVRGRCCGSRPKSFVIEHRELLGVMRPRETTGPTDQKRFKTYAPGQAGSWMPVQWANANPQASNNGPASTIGTTPFTIRAKAPNNQNACPFRNESRSSPIPSNPKSKDPMAQGLSLGFVVPPRRAYPASPCHLNA